MSKLDEACDAILDEIIRITNRSENTTYSKDNGIAVRNLAGAYEGLVAAAARGCAGE